MWVAAKPQAFQGRAAMGAQWKFEKNEQAQWRWIHVDDKDERVESTASFPNEAQCMMDAIRYVIRSRRSDRGGGEPTVQPH
jgi:hypothetical protein